MVTYSRTHDAQAAKRELNKLRAISENMSGAGVFKGAFGLTADMESAIANYASGTALSHFNTARDVRVVEAARVARAIASATAALSAIADGLEI